MLLIQIFLVVLFALAILKAGLRWRAGDLSIQGFLYWMVFWLAAAAVVIKPDATFYFANLLGIGRGADLVVYLALVLLFFLVFRLMITVERQKKEITELTRAVALKEKQNERTMGESNR